MENLIEEKENCGSNTQACMCHRNQLQKCFLQLDQQEISSSYNNRVARTQMFSVSWV